MELVFEGNRISLKRELSKLDEFVLKFAGQMDESNIDYAVVSGYVALVFGRSRGTEDVDVIARTINYAAFERFWKSLEGEFECLNADSAKEAFEEYLSEGVAVRFALKGTVIPNMEFKFAKSRLEDAALDGKLELLLNGKRLFISPLELQIAYKLFLGSEKDLEDARFLFALFKEKLDSNKLGRIANALGVAGKIRLLGALK